MPEREKSVEERLDDAEAHIRSYHRFAEAVDGHKNQTQRLTERYEELLGQIGEMHERCDKKMEVLRKDVRLVEDIRSRLQFALKTLGEP